MKILQLHNSYLYPGGEDAVAAAEAEMLRTFGHQVVEYRRSNKELSTFRPVDRLRFYLQDIYFSRQVYENIRSLIRKERPDVAHFHNSFFMIGPAAYEACFAEGVPVVQTLHNYRFLCAAATFFRGGKICEECLSGGHVRGVLHGCWHGSRLSTWIMTRVIREYERRGILKRIAKFIALSEFSRKKLIEVGWDPDRIVVKPNFLEKAPGQARFQGKYVLFIGALRESKGVDVLLKAWASLSMPVPLKIVGSGPLSGQLRAFQTSHVEWEGQKDLADVLRLMKDAVCLVVPSVWYENQPRVIVEAYACGIPVVASRLGSLEELVEDGKTGRLVHPGDPQDLARTLSYFVENIAEAERMGKNARAVFEQRYTAQLNHELLSEIYKTI